MALLTLPAENGEYVTVESSELDDAEFAQAMVAASEDAANPMHSAASDWVQMTYGGTRSFDDMPEEQQAEWLAAVAEDPDHPNYEAVVEWFEQGLAGEAAEGEWAEALADSQSQLDRELESERGRPLSNLERADIFDHASRDLSKPPDARASYEATKRDLSNPAERRRAANVVAEASRVAHGAEEPEAEMGRPSEPAAKQRRESALAVANARMEGQISEAEVESGAE